jgi:hypothetical protein
MTGRQSSDFWVIRSVSTGFSTVRPPADLTEAEADEAAAYFLELNT